MNKENLENYVKLNKTVLALKAELLLKKEEFDNENGPLINGIRDTLDVQERLKAVITEEAKGDFKATGDKHLLGGIGVRVGEKLIYDEEDALAWGKEHLLCLALDKKAFAKMAQIQNLHFVKNEETVTITFPKKIVLPPEMDGDE